MNKLVIISDYGLDDAAATAYLLSGRSQFDKINIVTCAGNVSAQKSFTNAHKLLAALGGNLSNVTIVSSDSIPQNYSELPDVHGTDGMGSIFREQICSAKVESYNDFIQSFDAQNSTVLSLGTLTVTKNILSAYPNVKSLVIMAGLVSAKPNYEGLEFNQALDKDACAFCYKSPHVAATLDTCRHSKFNLIGYKPKSDSAFAKILSTAIALAAKRHADNCYIYDLIASLYITDPQIFTAVKRVDPCGNIINQLELCKDFDFYRHLDEALQKL